MSAKGMLCAMVAGTALVMLAAARREPAPAAPAPKRSHEAPWLTPEAAAQIVGGGGSLGPLFDGVALGGPAPSAGIRARIAKFARANDVDIDLEVVEGKLLAVNFSVTFGGCCGYEGADVLALRMGRPETDNGCGGSGQDAWIDDWAIAAEHDVHMRARVRVNRVEARWERTKTLPELLERADGLLGMRAATVANAAPNQWITIERDRRYRLEVPYPFVTWIGFSNPVALSERDDLGVEVGVDAGQIVEIRFALRDLDGELRSTLRARWGRPRISPQDTWTWRTSDRIITADVGDSLTTITIRKS